MTSFKPDKLKLSLALFALLLFAVAARPQLPVKTVDETEVPVLKRIGSHNFRCWIRENAVVDDEQKFREIIADPNCGLLKSLDVDFTKQTLIGFRVGGDCFMRAGAKVFRRTDAKKYWVRIINIWGGCRAGGSFQGWLVIEKIPPGFTVEFSEMQVDRRGRDEDSKGELEFFTVPALSTPQKIETRRIDIKGCISLTFTNQQVIKNHEDFLKAIRNDARRGECLKSLEKIDFDKHALAGIVLRTGYCDAPLLYPVRAFRDDPQKQYVIKIAYLPPDGQCRASDRYDFWLLVPKLPDNHTVKFEVTAEPKPPSEQ